MMFADVVKEGLINADSKRSRRQSLFLGAQAKAALIGIELLTADRRRQVVSVDDGKNSCPAMPEASLRSILMFRPLMRWNRSRRSLLFFPDRFRPIVLLIFPSRLPGDHGGFRVNSSVEDPGE